MNKYDKLCCRHYYKLTQNVNAIPSGVYRFESKEELCLFFSVSQNVHFMLTDDCTKYLEKVSFSSAILTRTTSDEFLERYYELLGIHNSKPNLDGTPLTACFIAENRVEHHFTHKKSQSI